MEYLTQIQYSNDDSNRSSDLRNSLNKYVRRKHERDKKDSMREQIHMYLPGLVGQEYIGFCITTVNFTPHYPLKGQPNDRNEGTFK